METLKKVKDFIGTIGYYILFRILNDIERRLKGMGKDQQRTYHVIMTSGERKVVVSNDEVIEQMKEIKQIKSVEYSRVASEVDKSDLTHFSQVMEDN